MFTFRRHEGDPDDEGAAQAAAELSPCCAREGGGDIGDKGSGAWGNGSAPGSWEVADPCESVVACLAPATRDCADFTGRRN